MADERRPRRAGRRSAPADYIEVLSGPEDGKVFPVCDDAMVTIGRNPENAVCVPLELSISRRHARLTRNGDEYAIEVLREARNAARVRGAPLMPGERAILRKGEVFQLGDVEFQLGPDPTC
jgi:pSer/pThr/pTyr-binding forkhead associated (FHA) protein